METEVTRKLFTVDEFCRMGEIGIFGEGARLELIEGEILEMSAPGIRHASCVNRASALFAGRLAGKAMFSVRNPVLLSNDSMPQKEEAPLLHPSPGPLTQATLSIQRGIRARTFRPTPP